MYAPNLLFLLLVTILITDGDGTEKECFDNSHRPTKLNLTSAAEKDIRVMIPTSDTHIERVVPWILKIYFAEVLGFHNVTVGSHQRRPNYIEMDMERSPEFNSALDFLEGLSLSWKSRPIELLRWRGWFIPSRFTNHSNWWQFKDPEFALRHPGDPKAIAMILTLTHNYTDKSVSPWCDVSECTMMIADSEDATVIRQISEEKLYIRIYALKDYAADLLYDIVTSLLAAYPTMFFIYFGMYPGAYTSQRKHFQLIDSPPNDSLPTRSTVFRDEDRVFVTSEGSGSKNKNWILKVTPPSSILPELGKVIGNAHFFPEEYLQFMGTNKEDELNVACEWLKENENRALRWLEGPEEKLIIGVVLPTELQLYYDASVFEILALVRKALDKKEFSWNYQIYSLIPRRNSRQYDIPLDAFDRLIGTVGPAWSSTNYPRDQENEVVSYIQERGNRSFKTIASSGTYKYIYPKFSLRFDWSRVAIISDRDPVDSEILGLKNMFLNNNISVLSTLMITRDRTYEEIREHLRDVVQKRIKIIIVDESMESIYGILCAAFHLNMTAEQGYVWSLSGLLPDKWWRREFRSKDGNILCTFDELLRMINGHFSVAQVNFGPDDQIMQEGIGIGEWRKRQPLGQNAGFLYDACWTFIDAANRLAGNTSQVLEYIRGPGAEQFRKTISETDFYGVSGRVRFTENGSRKADFRIQQFINETYRTVANFQDEILTIDESVIVWLTGSVPTDGREPRSVTQSDCLFANLAKSLNVSCAVAYFMVFLMILVPLSITIVVGFFFFKKRYKKKLLESERLPKYELNEWEMPRNEVVIGHQIGEGAFGKVYGGQALLPDQGWVPVAVKTLKLGSSMLQKSDFLCEVESMKCFDHPNLIKLIGVCIKTEPVLTVMEFMVHGDLKAYLQARKETSHEIGSERLTGMAKDVLKALNYLDELKYVHRDVAARNCLINAEYVVKLGDFGMTRSMHENDYYRFNRKGLFPVRWMAVESLDSDVFTPASDIWSFGVLIFEVITFGRTPYEGRTNEQVVEYLKNGNTLSIPKAVTRTLKNLMNSCWKIDPEDRPTAGEIITILEANPNLVEP